MTLKDLKHKWLIAAGIFLLFLFYVGASGVRKSERRDLDLTTKVSAFATSVGKCDRFLGPNGGKGNSGWIFRPSIEYKYRFDGRNFVSTQIYRSNQSGFKAENECLNYIQELKSKKLIDVWIDPIEPNFSVVDPTKRSLFIEQTIGLLGVLTIILFIVINYKKDR